MIALALFLLGILAIGAVLTYYLIMMMLAVATGILIAIVSLSLLVSDYAGPLPGIMTFIILTALALQAFRIFMQDKPHHHGDST